MPYIEQIHIRDHYRIKELDVDLRSGESNSQPRHIIFTGVNGSGKTTILDKLAEEVGLHLEGQSTALRVQGLIRDIGDAKRILSSGRAHASHANNIELGMQKRQAQLETIGFHVTLEWAQNARPPGIRTAFEQKRFFAAHLPASRTLPTTPIQGPTRLDHQPTDPKKPLRQQFLQYLVNLHVQAKLAENEEEQQAIFAWIRRIETTLRRIFGIEDLVFVFRRKGFSLTLSEGGRIEYGFEHLPAGYMSVLVIIAEILLRTGVTEDVAHTLNSADISGVVIIDELGAHLHPGMQERVLPALIDFFPRFQFIIATHSPAIVSSIDNATVVDLPSGETVASTSLRATPYGDLMVGHFGIPTDFDRGAQAPQVLDGPR